MFTARWKGGVSIARRHDLFREEMSKVRSTQMHQATVKKVIQEENASEGNEHIL